MPFHIILFHLKNIYCLVIYNLAALCTQWIPCLLEWMPPHHTELHRHENSLYPSTMGHLIYHVASNMTDTWSIRNNAEALSHLQFLLCMDTLIARFMGPTPAGADRTQLGPMLAPWTLLSGYPDSLELMSSFISMYLFHTWNYLHIQECFLTCNSDP